MNEDEKMCRRRPLLIVIALLCLCGWTAAQQHPNPETLRYMQEASAFYLNEDYKHAITGYQKALDLEKKQRMLNETLWRVLVDNLGMSYGLTGDLKKAKETFEYGLSKDPKYPMFHYNMACTYAEMGDMDKTVSYLSQAFEYKANVIKGEKMPDPWKDSSFQRFINNSKFVKALKELDPK